MGPRWNSSRSILATGWRRPIALHAALHESEADVAAGRLVDADEILLELESP